jgi:hypothetical protein
MNAFEATVSALCYSIFEERCSEVTSELGFPHNQGVRFVLQQHAGMPDFLKLPFAGVTLLFGLSSIARYGRPFHQLPHHLRWKHVEAWRKAPVSVCRDLVRFYESFVIFYAYTAHSRMTQGRKEFAAAARTAA